MCILKHIFIFCIVHFQTPSVRIWSKEDKIMNAFVKWIYLKFADFQNFKTLCNYFCAERELLTPPLDGLILPGVTRQSILELSRQWNEFKVVEKRFTMSDLIRLRDENRVKTSLFSTLITRRFRIDLEFIWKNFTIRY